MQILIPAYRPDPQMLTLISLLNSRGQQAIVIVDDGSGPDYSDFFTAAEQAGCKIIHHPTNQGKGSALKTGFSHILATGEMDGVVCADCDGQHTAEDILRVAAISKNSATPITLGVRCFSGPVPWRSWLGNTLTRAVYALATGQKIADTQTGLRSYSAHLLPWLLSISGDRYEYELNILLEAQKAGFALQEVAISTIYDNNNSASHFNPLVDSIRIYLPLLRFSISSILAAIADFVLLLLMYSHTGNLLLSVVGARICSSLGNYWGNKHYVFTPSRDSALRSLCRYYSLVVAIMSANYALLVLLVDVIGTNLVPAKFLTESILFMGSYWTQKTYVFKNPGMRSSLKTDH